MPIRFREGKVIHEDVGTQVIGSLNIMNDAVGSQHLANNAVSYGAQIKDNILGYGELTTGLQGSLGALGPNSVGTTELKEPAVDFEQLYYDSVGTHTNIVGSFKAPAPTPFGLTYADDNHRFWNADDNEYIYEIGTTTGNKIGSFKTPANAPFGVEYAPDNHRLWYSDTGGSWNYIYQLGTITGNVIGSFKGPEASGIRDMAFDQATHRLWVAYRPSSIIYEIGTINGVIIGSILGESPTGLALATDKTRLWQSRDLTLPYIIEVDPSTAEKIGSLKFPNMLLQGVAYVPETHRLWFADAMSGYIFEVGTVRRYSHIRDGAVDSLSIQNDAIGSQHLANNAVSYAEQIKDNTIGYGEITSGLQGTIDCAHGTIHIGGTAHVHVTSGSINVREVGTFIVRRSGSFWQATQPVSGSVGIKGGIIRITSGSIDARIKSGTVAVKEVGTFIISGNLAHDAVDAGNPVKMGLKAIAYGANPNAVAAADRTDWYANRAGVPFVIAGHPNILCLRAQYTSAQTNVAIVTIAAGLKIVVTSIAVTTDNANGADMSVRIGFGVLNLTGTTGMILSHPGIAAGSGVVMGDGSGILGIGADDEDLRITCEAGTVDVVVSYFTIES